MNLKQEIKNSGATVTDFEKWLGYSRQVVSNYLGSIKNPHKGAFADLNYVRLAQMFLLEKRGVDFQNLSNVMLCDEVKNQLRERKIKYSAKL